MLLLGRILRTIALAVLFGGSAAIVFAAIVLVKTGVANGMTTAEAAFNNAPIFIHFSKVMLGAAVLLLLGEALDYAKRRDWSKLTIAQYATSLVCVIGAMIFSLGFVPPMEALLPSLKTDAAAHQMFTHLHETSRIVFGATILCALASLLLPIFGALRDKSEPSTSSG